MGLHTLIDLECIDINMNNKLHIKNFLNSIVKVVKMKKMIEPIVKQGTKYLPGVSGILLIETSHISIHTFTKQQRINIDIYSCKTYNELDIIDCVNTYFKTSRLLNKKVVERDDGQ